VGHGARHVPIKIESNVAKVQIGCVDAPIVGIPSIIS
jgi:hypothetical protein